MTLKELPAKKRIALVAHDGCKSDLLEWARHNQALLAGHELYGTGSTGALIEAKTGLKVHRFMSGPLGGDQQGGAAIPPRPPHPDVKALLRLAALHNTPPAPNRATADFLITSSLIDSGYARKVPDFARRLHED